jgi:AbrB family looped-hinge helix DNA binding protein
MAMQLTSKGQVTVPKVIREYLGIAAGSKVSFERLPGGEVVLRPVSTPGLKPAKSPFAGVRGSATVQLKTEEILALTRGA